MRIGPAIALLAVAVMMLAMTPLVTGAEAHHTGDVAAKDRVVTRVLARGADFHGANGIRFDAQDRLYIASVIGSTISRVDPHSGEVTDQFGSAAGVVVPDDVAFGPDGSLYWTGLFTGDIGRRRPDGSTEVIARLVPGANGITFSDNGRLFVGQCFFGDGLYEVDPGGETDPRLITDQLGPGCALNAMDWGPDGLLYGPRWFQGEVARVDVDSGDHETVVDGLGVPAAVKFDTQGRLHVLDTQAGEVLRIDVESGRRKVVAIVGQGMDNLAFDSRDRLFVSSYADGFVAQILRDGVMRQITAGGMVAPGGVAVLPGVAEATVFVADFFSLRAFGATTGTPRSVHRSVIGVSPLAFPLTVTPDGDGDLLITSWPDNVVEVFDPHTGEVSETYRNFAVPLHAIRVGGDLLVAELGTGSVVRASGDDPSFRGTVVDGLGVPAGLAAADGDVWVSDRVAGHVLQIMDAGTPLDEPVVVARDLSRPEGIAVDPDGGLLVIESGAGRLARVDPQTGHVRVLADGLAVGLPSPRNAPPTWVLNDVAVGPSGDIYVTGDIANVLYRITEVRDARGAR